MLAVIHRHVIKNKTTVYCIIISKTTDGLSITEILPSVSQDWVLCQQIIVNLNGGQLFTILRRRNYSDVAHPERICKSDDLVNGCRIGRRQHNSYSRINPFAEPFNSINYDVPRAFYVACHLVTIRQRSRHPETRRSH